MAYINQRLHDGTLIGRDQPLVAQGKEVDVVLNSAGAGAFATPSDYARKPILPSPFITSDD